MKPVGKPDAGNPHVRFDERGGETGCSRDTAPLLDSTDEALLASPVTLRGGEVPSLLLSKVPGLGDIPILGQLFRSHSTTKSIDELMVVITPHLVKPLPPGEMPKMPIFTVPFIAPPKEPVKKNKKSTKPAFVGQTGHEIPKQ